MYQRVTGFKFCDCGVSRQKKTNYMVDEQLPLRRVVADLRWLASFKSLVLFSSFYTCYILLSTIRMDWWMGHETLVWFREAQSTLGVRPLGLRKSIHEVADFIDNGVSPVVKELQKVCATCEVGITSKSTDMGFLGLEDFICSDFESQSGSNTYPSRSCDDADREWAASPRSTSAPCCHNTTLVSASIAMMTEALACEPHAPSENLLFPPNSHAEAIGAALRCASVPPAAHCHPRISALYHQYSILSSRYLQMGTHSFR
jgi:hypothetical protein